MKKKLQRKYLVLSIVLILGFTFFIPSMVLGLTPVSNYYSPTPNEFYRTDNRDIREQDLLYTGLHVGSIRGEKTGSLSKGSTPVLRSAANSSLGYAFYKPTELRSLATSLNGNPDYVMSKVRRTNIIEVMNPSKSEEWIWARDLGRAVGATVDLETTGGVDASGLPELRVVFNTTKFPKAAFTHDSNVTPTQVKAGEPFRIYVSTEEYDPYLAKISWKLEVNGAILDQASGDANTSVRTVNHMIQAPGTYTLKLTVMDGIERQTVTTRSLRVLEKNQEPGPEPEPDPGTEPEPEPNMPPIANIDTRSFYYWPELVTIDTISYDPDGEIVNETWKVDGNTIPGNTWQSPKVSEKVYHSAFFENMDDGGLSAQSSSSFEIWPTIPEAATDIEGTLKVNRSIKLDAKASDNVSPIKVAPIDYTRTTWKIYPVTEGLTAQDIKERPSSDRSIKQLLFKKAGHYRVEVTVTNIFDETSEIHVRDLEVVEDLEPIASFQVDRPVYLRDKDRNNEVTVHLTDRSRSDDQDVISQRIWYVEFDANNDGLFGTPEDGGKQVISQENRTSLTYKTKHVGNYRFSLEVKESFGQPTYEEFVEPHEYLRDLTNVLDEDGRVSIYQDVYNFNKAEHDVAVEIDNVPPIIDFGIKRKNTIELVFDFGGMDQATAQHLTGSRAGAGVGNGGGGGTYNHHYYTVNEQDKNALSTYAARMEANLRMKGLDVTVRLDNNYYRVFDADGTCVQNIPVWGWRDYGSYQYSSYTGSSPYSGSWEVTSSSSSPNYSYSSYSGTSPYSGDWEVLSSSSTPIYERRVTWCSYSYQTWSDAEKKMVTITHSHAPPCDKVSNSVYSDVQVGTRYTASLRKHTSTTYTASLRRYVPDLRYEVVSSTSEGCSFTEQIDTTDFVSDYANVNYGDADYKYYYRMDRNLWTWSNNATKRGQVANKSNNGNIELWNNSIESIRPFSNTLSLLSGGRGQFTEFSTSSLQANIQRVEDDLLNRFMIEENAESFTIVVGDKIDYTTVYEDFENDPELQREWKFMHDTTQVNGRLIDGQPLAPIPQHDLYINSPLQLNEVGTYTVTLRAKDNPLSLVGNDGRFANYQKWSDEEVVREYKVNVHRRPIADFTGVVEAGTLALTLDPSLSFDPDHKTNWSTLGIAERGIVEYTWEKYVLDGVEHSGRPPATLQANKDYYVTLRVKDIDGAYGTTTKIISTKNVNLRPVALFDSPTIVLRSSSLTNEAENSFIRDRSYDPNGDELTNYNWTIKTQNNNQIVWQGANLPTSFESIGLAAGDYLIGLTVWDIPRFPPSLQSSLYEVPIKVIENRPPTSCFELSRAIISPSTIPCTDGATSPHELWVNEKIFYTDKSSDVDGHPLINYSWFVEKLDTNNAVTASWNTGAAPVDFNQFGGIGRYRITQTVFDNPPSPLPSLGDTYVRYFNVVAGPQHPYAMFDYAPLQLIAGDTIRLTDKSWDVDGQVVQWEYRIEAPNGAVTTQVSQNPVITNAIAGTYKVTLNVWDNNSPNRLKSKIPAYKEILVAPKVLIPPTAMFTWEEMKPFLGESIRLNPDASYDLDGTIVAYNWSIRSKEGAITTSTTRYPTLVANSEYYDVTLTVRDNDNLTHSVTERIEVNIARLTPFVTHTPEWKDYWIAEGHEPDVAIFLAGEQFEIEVKTTPARRVEGDIYLGTSVGRVNIPSSAFTLVSKGTYEYVWRASLWQSNFEEITPGTYIFNFRGYHPDIATPTKTSTGNYEIQIQDSVYDVLNFHRNF